MAETFPEESSTSKLHFDEMPYLFYSWQFDTYGSSAINKSLVNNLRLIDPESRSIKITCAVVEEDDKIKDVDIKDAEKC